MPDNRRPSQYHTADADHAYHHGTGHGSEYRNGSASNHQARVDMGDHRSSHQVSPATPVGDDISYPERRFMNALLKYTTIALLIVIPLALISVNAGVF